MCCCKQPTINGQPIHAPTLAYHDELLLDEPGRYGGIEAHSHHFRLVKDGGLYALLVAHGGGEERIKLGYSIARLALDALHATDSNGRYWLLHLIYSASCNAAAAAQQTTTQHWRQAAAEKRIKTRKMPSRGTVKVWIEPPLIVAVENVP